LDQEEELVQLVLHSIQGTTSVTQKAVEEGDPSELQELSKKLFQVMVICCDL
jgi:hypothetical protein